MNDVDNQFHNMWSGGARRHPYLLSETVLRACEPLDFWELLLVRFYGKRIVSSEGEVTVEMYKFNGRFYVTRISDSRMGLQGLTI